MTGFDVSTALKAYQSGDFAAAAIQCEAALRDQPDCADALNLIGLISLNGGNHPLALDYLERAVESNPLSAEFRANLGIVLEKLSRIDDAITSYRRALQIEPGDPNIRNSLGAALYSAGQIAAALEEFAHAIELRPDFAEAYNNVGSALYRRGDIDLAIIAYQKAVAINPNLLDAQKNLAGSLKKAGHPEAEAAARLKIAGATAQNAADLLAAGHSLAALSLWDAAAEAYERALSLDPKSASAATALGNARLAGKNLDAAVSAYRRALELDPKSVEAMNNLGIALKDQGHIDDSLDCCEQTLKLDPQNAAVHSNLIYLLSFHPGYDPPELSRQQRKWNERHAAPLKSSIRPHLNDRNPDRRLRVGYVSPDLRRHVVGQNLFPLLSEHDRSQFEIHCYCSTPRPDAITRMLRSHTDVWHDVEPLSDESLAEKIRGDQIDILVDLSLHMGHNRLLTFARRPAPVAVTWLGYCSSTGLDAIDYRLSDPHLDPSETDLSLYSEETVHLPETWWCYQSAGPTPEPEPPPLQKSGHVTFGCLNNFAKVSSGSLDLWAEILAAVPRSKIIIHSHPGSHLDDVRKRFADAGVSPDRLEFVAMQSWPDYISLYSRIDIALDPFPYGGGITTCDALWMGVPVITLSGQTAVGRGGRSILSNIGLTELITRRPRQYVQTAITLAQSPERLGNLRSTLRHRMLTSPLTNARRFAQNVERAYRQIFARWSRSSA